MRSYDFVNSLNDQNESNLDSALNLFPIEWNDLAGSYLHSLDRINYIFA